MTAQPTPKGAWGITFLLFLFMVVNFADKIVVGLAAVIIGETLFGARGILMALIGCVIGSILYRIAIQLALSSDALGLQASDLNLVTAVLVTFALVLPRLRNGGGR